MNSDNILHNFNIIGSLQFGDKLNVINYKTYYIFTISHPTWYQSLVRTFYKDSRIKTSHYLDSLILFDLNNLLKQTLDKDFLDLLKSALEKANTGIYNLRRTYNNGFDINMNLLCLNVRILNILDEISKRNLSYIPLII